MDRIYIPYWKWEDWINGMWRSVSKEEEENYLVKAIEFTGNWILYGEYMARVVNEWENTMLNSLTNPSINKRAFVGHCACCLAFGCPEYIVRIAWKQLTNKQRQDADDIAEIVVKNWNESRNR